MSNEVTGFSVPLMSVEDVVTKVNTTVVNKAAAAYAAESDAEVYVSGEDYYPDLEWPASADIESVEINGSPVEVYALIGGTHAPQRPK